MPVVSGTFLRADGTPSSGSVAFAPSVAIGDAAEVRLPAPCEVHLDATGSIEVTLPATNDPDYTPSGWVWQVRERIAGGRDAWHFELTADTDYWDLVTVTPPEDYLPWTFTATATTGAPGTDAAVDVTGTPPAPVFEFTIPQGATGATGDEGPPNVLTIGTVTTEAPGDPATAAITGTSPAQVLDLGIPEGDKGDKGDQGDPGPTTDLSVGTVTTGAPGSSASADITGTPPTLELDLTIPRGDVGATGPANSLAIGTVTTGAAGSSAAATITGTPPSQTLDLTIPRGDTGATGMPSSLYDAKGDLITASANDTPVRLAVGIAGTNPILTPDTSAAGGLAWKSFIDAGVARAGVTTSSINVTWSAATPVLTVSAAATVTLPAASSNTGSLATIINIGTGSVAIARTGSDLIAGSLTSTSIPAAGSLRLVSDGTGWRVIDGRYTSSAVGLATYEWNHSGPGWRLVAYDSGVRDIGASSNPVWNQVNLFHVQRTLHDVRIQAQMATTAGGTFSTTKFWTAVSGFRVRVAQRGGSGVYINGGAVSDTHLLWTSQSALAFGYSGAVPTFAAGSTVDVAAIFTALTELPASLPGTQITTPV